MSESRCISANKLCKRVVLGRISGLFGVKGWVKVYSYTAPREAILDYAEWTIEKKTMENGAGSRVIKVAEGKRHGKSVIARLAGIDDRDAAAACVDFEISVSRSALPATPDGEYYWADLEGLKVVRKDGSVLGEVAYLLETGANDVLVVQEELQDREILIPYVRDDVIKNVDLDEGLISVDWEWT